MKKKILFVTNHFQFSDGVASVLRSLIANMPEDQYDISLLAIYKFDKEFAKPIVNKITIVKGFDFYFRGFDKIVNLLDPRLIYKMFIRDTYDLEVAFQIGIPTKCIAVSKNPHRVFWMHTYDAEMRFKKYYQQFPFIVNVAKAGYEKLITEGFERSKSEYCYNIIDESSIIEKSKEPIEYCKKKKFSVVTVARMAPDKGFLRYLRCIKEIIKTVKDTEFWIVGGGPDEEKMREYIRENELENTVIMFGKQTNPFKYVINADLYFCCSYREGFSTSCQEAALLGIPVVSVEVDGAKELVELSQCGRVIENDEEHMISGLTSVLTDIDLLQKWKRIAAESKYVFYKEQRINKILTVLKNNMS